MMEIADNVDYTYKGKVYSVQSIVKMKHPSTGKWVKAVHYIQWYNNQNRYVREYDDFMDKFTPYVSSL